MVTRGWNVRVRGGWDGGRGFVSGAEGALWSARWWVPGTVNMLSTPQLCTDSCSFCVNCTSVSVCVFQNDA